jgi:hypothetical protein
MGCQSMRGALQQCSISHTATVSSSSSPLYSHRMLSPQHTKAHLWLTSKAPCWLDWANSAHPLHSYCHATTTKSTKMLKAVYRREHYAIDKLV